MSDSFQYGLTIFCGVFCLWPILVHFVINWIMRILRRLHLPNPFRRYQ